MATNLKQFDSVGGFSVDNTTVINNLKDVKNVNTLELKNSEFSDSTRTQYILRGTNTAILGTDAIGSQIILPSETISFITGHIIGVNSSGGGHHSSKIESVVSCDVAGNVQVLSELTTIVKDSIPESQNWTVNTYDGGAANRFSYSVTRAGTTDTIKWIATVDVISILWL
jgi:hypothetical protein